ncbi:sugar kinase [Radiobacillus kanasensis]|uniref:sugar kinase n=1 Tax=Radiobacillus kanasensis TaxID=2844358 RepID=UPI001E64297D|nr:sugar kinase [Radiobacillus kanasensis]UFU01428.1 sugar kinase [Radiobacillus kanasensis]
MRNSFAAFGEVMMRLQVPGYKLLSQSNRLNYSFSGTGVNVAAALAQLGHTSYIVSTLPNNAIGDSAISSLRKLGIDTTFINLEGDYIGMYFLENGFGPRPSLVTYSNRRESSFNTATYEKYDFHEVTKASDVVHFCGITLAMNETVREQMKTFAKLAKENGCTIVFDCNYRPSLWGVDGHQKAKEHYEEMLYLADIVMMNEKDAQYTLGMVSEEKERKGQLLDLIPKVAETYNISIIAGTHRSINTDDTHTLQGFLFKDDTFSFSKTLSFRSLDRIGSGDAFTSGILHGEWKKLPDQETVDFATHASMLAHTIVGDTPLSSEMDIVNVMTKGIMDVER